MRSNCARTPSRQSGSIFLYSPVRLRIVLLFSFTVRGQANGILELFLDGPEQGERMGEAAVTPGGSWHTIPADGVFSGTHALYLVYRGEGTLDLRDIRFNG